MTFAFPPDIKAGKCRGPCILCASPPARCWPALRPHGRGPAATCTAGTGRCRRRWCRAARRLTACGGRAGSCGPRSRPFLTAPPAPSHPRGCPCWKSPARTADVRTRTGYRRLAASRRSPAPGRRGARRFLTCRRSA